MPTFYDRFVECAERWPQDVAVEIQRPEAVESYTYSELRHMAESFGGWLVARGIEPGARIAILAENHPRWVAAYLGIIAAGGTAVPLDTGYHADQVAKLLRDSGSSLLVCDPKHLETAREAVSKSEVGIVLTHSALGAEGQARAAVPTQVEKEERTPVAREPIADLDNIFSQRRAAFTPVDRKSTRLNSSHTVISYSVLCMK